MALGAACWSAAWSESWTDGPVVIRDESMTVLVVSDHGETGGTRDYLQLLIDFYTGLGWKVLLLSATHRGHGALTGQETPEGVCLVRMEDVFGSREALQSPWKVAASAWERRALSEFVAANHVDLVVASAGTPGALLPPVQAVVPSIYLLHTYPHGRRMRLLGRMRFRRSLENVDQVLTVSHAARAELVNSWGLAEAGGKVKVVYSTAGAVADVVDVAGADTVLAVGHVVDYKGPDLFLEMAEQLATLHPNVSFTWAGGGPLLEKMRVGVKDRGLTGRVNFVGHQADLEPLLQRAAVYVQPSRIESLGLALLDAGRHGIPAVVPRVGGMPEVVIDGETGLLVDTPRAELLAAAVGALLDDVDERTRLGTNARNQYERRFSPGRWEIDMLSAHQAVLTTER